MKNIKEIILACVFALIGLNAYSQVVVPHDHQNGKCLYKVVGLKNNVEVVLPNGHTSGVSKKNGSCLVMVQEYKGNPILVKIDKENKKTEEKLPFVASGGPILKTEKSPIFVSYRHGGGFAVVNANNTKTKIVIDTSESEVVKMGKAVEYKNGMLFSYLTTKGLTIKSYFDGTHPISKTIPVPMQMGTRIADMVVVGGGVVFVTIEHQGKLTLVKLKLKDHEQKIKTIEKEDNDRYANTAGKIKVSGTIVSVVWGYNTFHFDGASLSAY